LPGYTQIPSDTDCILVLECLAPWMPGRFEPPPHARIIRIGTDPLGSVSPTYDFPCDLAITAHAASALPALLDAIDQTPSACDRLDRLRGEGRALTARALDAAAEDARQSHLTPRFLSQAIGRTLPPETIIVHELVDASLFNRTQPGTLFGTGGSGIGWSGPAAIGAKLAAHDRPVVAAVGDGSWMFANPQVTLWASRFHAAPVLFLVFNNRGYGVGTRAVLEAYPEGYAARSGNLNGGWFDPTPNFAAEASASGVYAEKVSRPEDVVPALQRGLDSVTRQGCPALIEFWLPKLVTGEL
jgi:acetolactate synthase-1/2/3 large subunit